MPPPPKPHFPPPLPPGTRIRQLGEPLLPPGYNNLPPQQKVVVGRILHTWLDWFVSRPEFKEEFGTDNLKEFLEQQLNNKKQAP